MRAFWLILFFTVCVALSAQAQKPDTTRYRSKADSLARKRDSAESVPFLEKATRVRKNKKVEVPDSLHSPHTAVIRSLILPGLGQIYNRHYIKVPIIIGGLATAGYFLFWNQNMYTDYLAVARFQQTGKSPSDPEFANDPDRLKRLYQSITDQRASAAAVIELKDYYRRNRDLLILGIILGWGIQAVDAYVWAKFKHSYTMDNNLSKIHFSGGAMPTYALTNVKFVPSLKITIDL